MTAEVFWTKERYPGRIALVARPRGGDWIEDETSGWAADGIDIIVSMLEAAEINTFALEREAELCEANNIDFISFPVPDRGVPILDRKFWNVVDKLKNALSDGKNVGIHCRQSIGRAPLLAAAVMASLGMLPDDAFRELSRVRGLPVPETAEQKRWVERFAEESVLARV